MRGIRKILACRGVISTDIAAKRHLGKSRQVDDVCLRSNTFIKGYYHKRVAMGIDGSKRLTAIRRNDVIALSDELRTLLSHVTTAKIKKYSTFLPEVNII